MNTLLHLTTLYLIVNFNIEPIPAQFPLQQLQNQFASHARAFANARAEAHSTANTHAQSNAHVSSLPILNVPQGHFPHNLQEPQQTAIPERRVSIDDLVEEEWLEFKLAFNKVYHNPEVERFRKENFIENRAKIARSNQEYSKGLRNFAQRMNPFGDMLVHEFNSNLNGFNRSSGSEAVQIPEATTFIRSANVIFPDSVDWRQVGAVSPVRSQQLCAGCWAFAAAGALEGQTFRKTGKLVEVSVQNLLDCTRTYGNDGCKGGLMIPAYQYIRENDGVNSEGKYPEYEAEEKQCRFRRENVVATCSGYVSIPEGDEQSLEIAVATLGPVTAAIDASRDSLQFYSDGVYYDAECANKPDKINHAVLVVGYGVEPSGQKYWLVKNSYGTQWGIGGYMKIAKNAGNHCGIATYASYPLV